jgi:hypothetical protein
MPQAPIKCKVCEGGELKRTTVYRMSTPVVMIGYIFLAPSILGMLLGVLLMVGMGKASVDVSSQTNQQIASDLQAKNIPDQIVTAVKDGKSESEMDLTSLTSDQKNLVHAAIMNKQAANIGAGAASVVGGMLAFGIIVMSFVGGLLGWLLVMKKKVLKCISCESVIAAS